MPSKSFHATSNETTPLLSEHLPTDASKHAKPQVTPIPKVKLGVVCAIRLAEPVAFHQIFPYINDFISDLHVTDDPKRVGFYSGLVESTFSVFQLSSIYFLAKLSDHTGRRPVILLGVVGISISTLLFGVSKSLLMVLVARAIAGVCSGNIAVMHAVVGEITDPSNQALVLPIYGLMWPVGIIIGPLIGGTLEHPATKFPKLFDLQFLRTYPYFLPCFVTALFGFLGVLLCYFFLEETHPKKRRATAKANLSSSSSSAVDTPKAPEPDNVAHGMISLLSIPVIRALCGSGFAMSFLSTAFNAVFVLYCYTTVENGGIGLSASHIGLALSTSGILAMLAQLALLPYLLRTFEKTRMYHFCMCLWPPSFFLLATLNPIARIGYHASTGTVDPSTTAVLWICIAVLLALTRIACLAFGLSMLLSKENSPNAASLGASNGLVQTSMSFSRAIGPAFASSAFALSIDKNLLGGYLWVIAILLISFAGVYQSSSMVIRAGRL